MRDYEPFGGMLSLREAMNRLLEDNFVAGGANAGTLQPPLDLYETGEALVARMAIPGASVDLLDITIDGDTLTVRGEVREPQHKGEVRYYRREHRYGSFVRSVALPVQVQPERVEATFEHGILTLTLPRAEHLRPRSIKITTRGGGRDRAPVAIDGSVPEPTRGQAAD